MRNLPSARVCDALKLFAVTFLMVLWVPVVVRGQGAPPVRIAVVPGGGSGIEQEVVDRISGQLQESPNIAVSTVNPDWYVVCNIKESADQMSGAIRYNGNILVKTVDGQVIKTVAVQKYNQDFSLTPGATLNKALVDGAARDVISGLTERAVGPIEEAVEVEMVARGHAVAAFQLADQDKFEQAMAELRYITPESVHFRMCQDMMMQLSTITGAHDKAKHGQYAQAVAMLKKIDKHSKFYDKAVGDIISYQKKLAPPAPVLVKNKVQSAPHASSTEAGIDTSHLPVKAQLKNLNQADKALDLQRQAIQASESALEIQQSADKKSK